MLHLEIIAGAPAGIRTPNLLIRSQMLYPVELRAQYFVKTLLSYAHQKDLLLSHPQRPL